MFMISGATLNMNGQGGKTSYESFERDITIPAGETRCLCITGDNAFYQQVTINTYVSHNLPSQFTIVVPSPVKSSLKTAFDGVLTVDNVPERSENDVIIVDDSEPGCVINSKDTSPFFQKLLINTKAVKRSIYLLIISIR